MARKKLPIGIDDFSEIRAKDYYFVDKSLMIRDFLEMGGQGRTGGKTKTVRENPEYDDAAGISGYYQG